MPYLLTTAPATAELPLLRREPAALAASAQAVLSAAVALAAYWLPDQLGPGVQALILAASAAVLAAVVGWRTAPSRPALVWGALQALLPLGVLCGLALPPGADAAVLALLAAALGLGHRSEVTPVAALPPADTARSLP